MNERKSSMNLFHLLTNICIIKLAIISHIFYMVFSLKNAHNAKFVNFVFVHLPFGVQKFLLELPIN